MTESRIRPIAYFLISFLGIIYLLAVLLTIHSYITTGNIWMLLTVVLILMFSVWIFSVIKKGALYLSVENDKLTVRKYFGLGKERVYYFSQIKDYKIFREEAESASFEAILLIWQEEVKISEYYFENYLELKNEILKAIKKNKRAGF